MMLEKGTEVDKNSEQVLSESQCRVKGRLCRKRIEYLNLRGYAALPNAKQDDRCNVTTSLVHEISRARLLFNSTFCSYYCGDLSILSFLNVQKNSTNATVCFFLCFLVLSNRKNRDLKNRLCFIPNSC